VRPKNLFPPIGAQDPLARFVGDGRRIYIPMRLMLYQGQKWSRRINSRRAPGNEKAAPKMEKPEDHTDFLRL